MQKATRYLSSVAHSRAANFLRAEARPLEVSRLENIFYGSGIERVLIELGKFQNIDGGFGHALEPDLRAPESSALCTSIAFQIIREHQVSKDEAMVRRGIHYLQETFDQSKCHWRIIPESAESAPHAPWWNQKVREDELSDFSLNPTAELLGYLLDYGRSVVDERIISQIADRVVATLRSIKVLEMHDLLCCLRLLETENLSLVIRDNVYYEIRRLVTDTVATDQDQWNGYCLRPLQVIRRPDSPFMDRFKEAVSLNLDFEIGEQTDNGSWSPTWSWGDQYADSWATAKREWSGVLTLDKLLIFERFNRIEKMDKIE